MIGPDTVFVGFRGVHTEKMDVLDQEYILKSTSDAQIAAAVQEALKGTVNLREAADLADKAYHKSSDINARSQWVATRRAIEAIFTFLSINKGEGHDRACDGYGKIPQPISTPSNDAHRLACRDSFLYLIGAAIAEAQRAMIKYPQPNYVITKFSEESGEAIKAMIHCAEGRETADNVRAEMTQAIAMLYRLWVEGDQVHGLKPLAEIGGAA